MELYVDWRGHIGMKINNTVVAIQVGTYEVKIGFIIQEHEELGPQWITLIPLGDLLDMWM